jgi:hypothetical protein
VPPDVVTAPVPLPEAAPLVDEPVPLPEVVPFPLEVPPLEAWTPVLPEAPDVPDVALVLPPLVPVPPLATHVPPLAGTHCHPMGQAWLTSHASPATVTGTFGSQPSAQPRPSARKARPAPPVTAPKRSSAGCTPARRPAR